VAWISWPCICCTIWKDELEKNAKKEDKARAKQVAAELKESKREARKAAAEEKEKNKVARRGRGQKAPDADVLR